MGKTPNILPGQQPDQKTLKAIEDDVLNDPLVQEKLKAFQKTAPIVAQLEVVLEDPRILGTGLPLANETAQALGQLTIALHNALEKRGISDLPAVDGRNKPVEDFEDKVIENGFAAKYQSTENDKKQVLALTDVVTDGVFADPKVQERIAAFQKQVPADMNLLAKHPNTESHTPGYIEAEQQLLDTIAESLKAQGITDAPTTKGATVENIPALMFEASVIHFAEEAVKAPSTPTNKRRDDGRSYDG